MLCVVRGILHLFRVFLIEFEDATPRTCFVPWLLILVSHGA
ncbi:hypothetical protein GLYMA_07G230001v4 [Glycine max]|nr:hypothetical protein GLYMA_07G230001v4 [Glycine max]KAH1088201.1 hypothetical protein GYH30_019308 [Glycine max]